MPKSLGQFIETLGREHPDELVTVARSINPAAFEVTALLENLEREGRHPVVLFSDPRDVHGKPSQIRLVSNVFARRERSALAFDLPPSSCRMPLSLEYARREKAPIAPVSVAGSAPVHERVFRGGEIDVGALPIVRHYEMDMGPVLTMTCCMRDPDSGVYDISFIKVFYKDRPDYMGVSIHSPHLERIVQRYAELGKPAPIIAILGHHPAFFFGVLAATPFEQDDYATAGGFLGEPLRLAPSVTWGGDFLVPADAEVIIEGEILPGVREVVDPFGEVLGDYQAQCLRQAMQVTALTHRQGAVMQDIFTGHKDHWVLAGITREGTIYNAVQGKVGNVVAIHRPTSGATLSCYIAIRKVAEGQAKRTGLIALTEVPFLQVAVVVDENIDVYKDEEVLWAVLTMADPQRGVDLLRNVGTTAYSTAFRNNKVVIDATRPIDRPFPVRFRVPPEVLAAIRPAEWIT